MDKTSGMMLRRDVAVVLGFMVFLWVTMGFLMYSILTALGPSRAKNVIIAIGITVLLLATLSLTALILHLRRHCDTIYVEELRHAHPEAEALAETIPAERPPARESSAPHVSSPFVKVFDILFIMVLCFVTLLATMLLRGKTVNNADIYIIGIPSVLLTVVGFTVYFLYILRHSQRELKSMIAEMYREEGDGVPVTGDRE